MDHTFCPGARMLRQPKPETFSCPACGSEVEIWTDEFRRPCPACGKSVFRDAGMSCIEWCRCAEDCLGADAYDAYMNGKRKSIRERLLGEIEAYFGTDGERISHARTVLAHAEAILREVHADWHVVIPVSILHDVGIKPAEEKYGSAQARCQEAEGPPVARKMLLELDYDRGAVREICDIIAHHHSPGPQESINFQVLYDADTLTNNQRRIELGDTASLSFFTDAARRIASRMKK